MHLSKIFTLFASFLALVALERFCHWQTGSFSIAKATTSHLYPLSTRFSSPSSKQTALPELDQPFYFLASGAQSYVFLSKDGKTILKLFKHYHGPFSIDLLKKFPFTHKAVQKREKRMHTLFASAQIAYERLSEETGVYFTHLQKTKSLFKKIEIYDKLGIQHRLDLDQTEFVLQKRAEVAFQRFHKLFTNHQIAEASKEMKQLLVLIENRSKKGIKNKDGKIMKNYGFLGEKPVELDIGSFVVRSSRSTSLHPHKKARMKAARQLLSWIKQQYPQHFSFCKKELLDENSD